MSTAQLVLHRAIECDACKGRGSVFECGTDAGLYTCRPCHGLGYIDISGRETDWATFLENYKAGWYRWAEKMQDHPKVVERYWEKGPMMSPLSMFHRGPEDYPEGLEVLPKELASELLALTEHLFENADPHNGFDRFVYPVQLLHSRIKQAVLDLNLSASWMWTR